MGSDWTFLLQCLRGEVDGLSEILQPASWPAVPQLADDHGVIPQLCAALLRNSSGACPPADVARDLQERQRAIAFSSLRLNAELFRVSALLQNAGLEFALVKGPALGVRAYGHAGAREYGDLDFLVRHRDMPRLHGVMTNAGYRADVPSEAIHTTRIPGQYLFAKEREQLIVEFHTERTMRYFPRGLPLEDFLARREFVAIEGHHVPALALEDELILVCIHGSKHLWERLSYIADVSGLIMLNKNMDLGQAFATAQKIGVERMLSTGLILARDVLGAPVPPAISVQLSADQPALLLATQILNWLPFAGAEPPGLFPRMRYRLRMSGGGLSGIAHLSRLIFSPTQEDWGATGGSIPSQESDSAMKAPSLPALRRIVRLAKKYHRRKRSA